MRIIANLVKRNFLIYLRDKSAVFFSFMAMLIVIGLAAVFLGGINVDEIVELLNTYGGPRDKAVDLERAEYLVKMWTIAGILIVNSVTISLTTIGNMVQDNVENRLASFYVAPVKRILIALGYIISAVIVTTIMCIITLIVAEGYIYLGGGEILGMVDTLKIIGLIVLNAVIYSFIIYLLALFVKSSSAWSGISTIVGTLVGFVGAIYLPMGSLPENVGNVLKYMPFIHGAGLMRDIFTREAIATTFDGLRPEVIDGYKEAMGITIIMNDKIVSPYFQMAFLLGCGIIALAAAALVLRKRAVSDR